MKLEEIAIEAVRVGDRVCVDSPRARRVLAKCAKSNERTARVVGWLVSLADGDLVWLSRDAKLWCRRRD